MSFSWLKTSLFVNVVFSDVPAMADGIKHNIIGIVNSNNSITFSIPILFEPEINNFNVARNPY
ncbi:MAG: hypothetical protein WAM42_07105 [Candidatus Nitrosopolaris sp.]